LDKGILLTKNPFVLGMCILLSLLFLASCGQGDSADDEFAATTQLAMSSTPTVELAQTEDSVDVTPSLPAATIPTPIDAWIRPMDGMVMVFVPAGSFQMGSSEQELEMAYALCEGDIVASRCPPGRFDDETPQHTVTLDAFWIDQTEVTNAQYQQCIDAGGCEAWDCYPPGGEMGGGNYPTYCISWYQAKKYCAWAGERLPTEAEWEYVARGPTNQIYPWGNEFDGNRLNSCDINCYNRWRDPSYDDGYNTRALVGTYINGTSWCSALDLAGNVAEWVADWYDPDYYSFFPSHNPPGHDTGTMVVFKGGACNHVAGYVRSA
jgi:formylglycine-generating enzyme required for sulfatase activity